MLLVSVRASFWSTPFVTLLGGMLRQLDKEMQTRRFESKITILNKVMGAEGHKITQQYIPRLVVNVGGVFPSVLRSAFFFLRV